MTNCILAIDTSAGTSVAVVRGGVKLSEINFDENMKHAERIGDAIAQAIGDAQIQPGQINNVVVGRGPAPFTGLRIGIAAAIMYSEGADANLFGVTSLDAIAYSAIEAGIVPTKDQPLLVTADARRKEIYWALYTGVSENGAPISTLGPSVGKPDEVEEKLAMHALQRTDQKIHASALAKVFEAQVLDGTASNDVTALYLREADAVPPKDIRDASKKVSG